MKIVNRMDFQVVNGTGQGYGHIKDLGARVEVALSDGQRHRVEVPRGLQTTEAGLRRSVLEKLAADGRRLPPTERAELDRLRTGAKPPAPSTAPAAKPAGGAVLRGFGALGFTGMVADIFIGSRDAKDPKKVEAYADKIRRGEMLLEQLPPFSDLARAVKAELSKGESA